jgi:hypothetical protein
MPKYLFFLEIMDLRRIEEKLQHELVVLINHMAIGTDVHRCVLSHESMGPPYEDFGRTKGGMRTFSRMKYTTLLRLRRVIAFTVWIVCYLLGFGSLSCTTFYFTSQERRSIRDSLCIAFGICSHSYASLLVLEIRRITRLFGFTFFSCFSDFADFTIQTAQARWGYFLCMGSLLYGTRISRHPESKSLFLPILKAIVIAFPTEISFLPSLLPPPV